jgi:hypothetical protein
MGQKRRFDCAPMGQASRILSVEKPADLPSQRLGLSLVYTLIIRLPRFSPASNPIRAFGVFSRPSITSS